MTTLQLKTLGATALAFGLVMAAPAEAQLGLVDCSAKYSAAKDTGKLGNKTFEQFKKTDCGVGAKPLPAATTPAAKPAAAAAPAAAPAAKPAAAAPAATTPAATAAQTRAEKRRAERAAKAPVAKGPVTGPVFPTVVADAYKSKKAGKARLLTCLDQFKTNKATNANGGLRWIQKGGGYYSQCNKKLKG